MGSLDCGTLMKLATAIVFCLTTKYVTGQEVERGLVSYVLENFDTDLDDENARNALLGSIDGWAGNTTSNGLSMMVASEALHGNSSLQFHYRTDQGGSYVLQSILNEGVHSGALGATHAFFSYRHLVDAGHNSYINDFVWHLLLFDSAGCQDNCSHADNLEAWEYFGGPLVAGSPWQTVSVPLDSGSWNRVVGEGNNVPDFRKLKGWRLTFSSETNKLNGTIIVDQLALDGDGSMVGAVFQSTSWDELVERSSVSATYYGSELSENRTNETIRDGHFYLNYTIEQTEAWGGFVHYDFSSPGRAFFNLSRAEAIGLNYEIVEPSSVSDRAHLRLILTDRSHCWEDCWLDSADVEIYYSFHYILDKPGAEGSVAMELEGDPDSDSPFWRTGWFGAKGNDVLDKSMIKGFKVEISIDSQGEIGSLVSGVVGLSALRANEIYIPDATDTAKCIVEADLYLRTDGVTKFVTKEFLNFAECCHDCDQDPWCTFAFSDGLHCYKTQYVHHDDVDIWTNADAVMHTFVKRSEQNFCDVCECRKSEATIDCRGRDLALVPRIFDPDGNLGTSTTASWNAKMLDLRGNPRLTIMQAGALDALQSLEVLELPTNLKHLSPFALANLPSLMDVHVEETGSFNNVISSPSDPFADVCCSLGDQMLFAGDETTGVTLTFCELEPDSPGVDALYEDFVHYLDDASLIEEIRPSSSFMSEAAMSVQLCAEYCNIVSDCNYFSYDARLPNTEHVCWLLSSQGTPTTVCCDPDHYADEAKLLPGWISGTVPRTRNEKYNARVLVDISEPLILQESNGYRAQYQLRLGAIPRRGAVWVTPTITSQANREAEVFIVPPQVVLYDNETVITVDVSANEPSHGGAIVIENMVVSCDTAFSSSKTNLTIYAAIDVPSDSSTVKYVLIFAAACVFVVVMITAFFLYYVERKKRQADHVWQIEPEELNFDNPPKVLGKGSFGLVLLADYRGTQVAVKRVLPCRGGRRSKVTESQVLSKRFDATPSLGTSVGVSENSEYTESGDVEDGTQSLGALSHKMLGQENRGSSHYRGGKGPDRLSSDTIAKAKHWRTAFKKNRKEDHAALRANFIEEMRHLSKLRHPCITTVMGAVIKAEEDPMLVLEYMDNGSLYDMLQNETMVLDGEQVLPILKDISQGVRFLHSATPQVIHGDIKAKNILVDNRLRAKVADFGLRQKKRLGSTGTPYWMAPELLRGHSTNTSASDVYSFGIVLYEVYSRKEPYEGEDFIEVMEKISHPAIDKRPGIPRGCPREIALLMTECQKMNPEDRPSFQEIDTRLRGMDSASLGSTLQRSLFASKRNLQKDTLINELFPPHIAKALREGRKVEPESRDMVTIVFSDIVGFTALSSQLSAMAVSDMLDRLYNKFDDLSRKHDVFKVETIGDSWMGVTNLTKDQPDHVQRVARFAIDAMKEAQETWVDPTNHSLGKVNIRMGFHSGPVVANVIGSRNPRYCLFGDTVNSSSRMESHSLPGCIQCSEISADILKNSDFAVPITSRGKVKIKGKGLMHCFWVGDTPRESAISTGQIDNQTEIPTTTNSVRLQLTTSNPTKAPLCGLTCENV